MYVWFWKGHQRLRLKANISKRTTTYEIYKTLQLKNYFNPLIPVPAITGRAKTHSQFPVPAVTSHKKACEDNCLSYPPWKHLGSPIVLLLSRTNKPMRMDFPSIFLEDFRGPRKTVFVLKSHAQKVQVIMARCGPNLQTSRVLLTQL